MNEENQNKVIWKGSVLWESCTDFSCLAGDCPVTCCSGWKIVVDKSAYERFTNLSDEKLKNDILSHIVYGNGELRFRNRKDGSCTMLDADGLCRIQRHTEEAMLCNTCRKFPRLSGEVENQIWLSMSASCPQIAKKLMREDDICFWYLDKEQKQKVTANEISVISEGMKRYQTQKRRCEKKETEKPVWFLQYVQMMQLADAVTDIILKYPEITYLTGSLDYFEKDFEISMLMQDRILFQNDSQKMWNHFRENYLKYRFFSRYLEQSTESFEDRYIQVVGELSLIQMMVFSRTYMLKELSSEQIWVETICWVYRFCVHGEQTAQKVHNMFCDFFNNLEEDIYILTE